MSTRGAVAIKNGSRWLGVYNHWDSYPTGLGKELWDYLHQDGIDIKQFAESLPRYDDWRNFRDGGICPYCGKVGMGQPHSIRGDICYPSLIGEYKRYESADEMREYFSQLPAWQGRDEEIEQEISLAVRIADNIKRTGYPDPEAKHHGHGDLTDKVTNDNAAPCLLSGYMSLTPS